jgi:hypothetical protein
LFEISSANVTVADVIQVIRNKLHNDDTLVERSVLQVEGIMKLLEVCLRTRYFHVDDEFLKQKDGMAIGSCLSPIVRTL